MRVNSGVEFTQNKLAIIYSIPIFERVHHTYKIGSSSGAMQCIVKMAQKSEVIQFGRLKWWMLECPDGIAEYFEYTLLSYGSRKDQDTNEPNSNRTGEYVYIDLI
jgi:hypothetical protein